MSVFSWKGDTVAFLSSWIALTVPCVGYQFLELPNRVESLFKGPAKSEDEMKTLFMKIDANANGTIDFFEFASYMMSGSDQLAKMKEDMSVCALSLGLCRLKVHLDKNGTFLHFS